jgi:hypothetical protein
LTRNIDLATAPFVDLFTFGFQQGGGIELQLSITDIQLYNNTPIYFYICEHDKFTAISESKTSTQALCKAQSEFGSCFAALNVLSMTAWERGDEFEYRSSLNIVDQDIYHFVVTNCLGHAATLSLRVHLLNPSSELSTLQYAEPFIAGSATLLWLVLLLVLAYNLTLTSRYTDCGSARVRYKQHHVLKQCGKFFRHVRGLCCFGYRPTARQTRQFYIKRKHSFAIGWLLTFNLAKLGYLITCTLAWVLMHVTGESFLVNGDFNKSLSQWTLLDACLVSSHVLSNACFYVLLIALTSGLYFTTEWAWREARAVLAVALVYALIHSALFDIPLARAVVFVVAIKLVTSYLGHNIRALKVQLTALHEHGGVESTRTYFKYQLFKSVHTVLITYVFLTLLTSVVVLYFLANYRWIDSLLTALWELFLVAALSYIHAQYFRRRRRARARAADHVSHEALVDEPRDEDEALVEMTEMRPLARDTPATEQGTSPRTPRAHSAINSARWPVMLVLQSPPVSRGAEYAPLIQYCVREGEEQLLYVEQEE